MDQRDDYRELDTRPPWVLRFMVRRVLPVGICLLVVGVVIVLIVLSRPDDGYSPRLATLHRAENIALACQWYARQSPDGKYPATLAELQKPMTPGRAPWVDEIADAWGTPFRYALIPNESGVLEPYIFTERTCEGRNTILGAKVAADGTIVVFGRPPKD
jgi:hypothetical protein